MNAASLGRAFERFFFTPQSPLPIALFRICYGLCVTATLLLLFPDWLEWFGVHGWISSETMSTIEPGFRLNLFWLLPQDDHWIQGFFFVALGFSILLTVGLWTRVSSVAVYLSLVSIQERNLLITHGGDTFLRLAGFFLMFSPAGSALSIDRWLTTRTGTDDGEALLKAPWAQRMIQIELSVLYCTSFWWKSKGHTWWDGSALDIVTRLQELRRFPLPTWILNPMALKIGTWLALSLEFFLGTLIWFRPFRYRLLIVGVLFHLCLEYAINIPMFQWDVLTAYVLFLEPDDLTRWFARIRRYRIDHAWRRA